MLGVPRVRRAVAPSTRRRLASSVRVFHPTAPMFVQTIYFEPLCATALLIVQWLVTSFWVGFLPPD